MQNLCRCCVNKKSKEREKKDVRKEKSRIDGGFRK